MAYQPYAKLRKIKRVSRVNARLSSKSLRSHIPSTSPPAESKNLEIPKKITNFAFTSRLHDEGNSLNTPTLSMLTKAQ